MCIRHKNQLHLFCQVIFIQGEHVAALCFSKLCHVSVLQVKMLVIIALYNTYDSVFALSSPPYVVSHILIYKSSIQSGQSIANTRNIKMPGIVLLKQQSISNFKIHKPLW